MRIWCKKREQYIHMREFSHLSISRDDGVYLIKCPYHFFFCIHARYPDHERAANIDIMFYAFIHTDLYLASLSPFVHGIKRLLEAAFKTKEYLMYPGFPEKPPYIVINTRKLLHSSVNACEADTQVFVNKEIAYLLHARDVYEKITVPDHECIYIICFCKIFKL